jgi:hypothetical protein
VASFSSGACSSFAWSLIAFSDPGNIGSYAAHIDVQQPKIKGKGGAEQHWEPTAKHGQMAVGAENRPSGKTLIQILPCLNTTLARAVQNGNHSGAGGVSSPIRLGKTMTRSRQSTLPDEVRRQFGSAGTKRFLRALPAFRIDEGIPERFQNLLAELDRVEADRRKGRSRNMTEN